MAPPPTGGGDICSHCFRSTTVSPLSIQLLDSLMKFFIEVADHVIKGDVSLALGLQVLFMLDEPRVDLITHLDRLHMPPLCASHGYARCATLAPISSPLLYHSVSASPDPLQTNRSLEHTMLTPGQGVRGGTWIMTPGMRMEGASGGRYPLEAGNANRGQPYQLRGPRRCRGANHAAAFTPSSHSAITGVEQRGKGTRH
jgi:hypothetical protein